MVVGESGLGKSTLINSMFLTDIYQVDKMPRVGQTLKVEAHKVKLVEHEVNLTLTVVDTPGKCNKKPSLFRLWLPTKTKNFCFLLFINFLIFCKKLGTKNKKLKI